jgi:hypothetical protein
LGKPVRKLHVACLVPLLLGCWGAVYRPEADRPVLPAAPPIGVVFVANGSGDFRTVSTSLRQVVAATAAPLQIETCVWSHGRVRTPWTLASEAVWNQTHRVAGWLWVAGGLIGCVGVLALPLVVPVSEPTVLIGAFVWIMIIALYPVIYSLVLYKRLERQGKL